MVPLSPRPPGSVHIRWMIRRDMPEVLAIEQRSYVNPWIEEDFLHCLRQRNCVGMVAEIGELVVGHIVYELHTRILKVLNLAVHPHHRNQGVGRQMIEKLVSRLTTHGRSGIHVDVRETNIGAQLFLKSVCFAAIKLRRKYYDDTGEDAYLMERVLGQRRVGKWLRS